MTWNLSCAFTPIDHPTREGINVFEQDLLLNVVADDNTVAALPDQRVYSVWLNALVVRYFFNRGDAAAYSKSLAEHLAHISLSDVTRITQVNAEVTPTAPSRSDKWQQGRISAQEIELRSSSNEPIFAPGAVAYFHGNVAMGGHADGPFATSEEAVSGARAFQQRVESLIGNGSFAPMPQASAKSTLGL